MIALAMEDTFTVSCHCSVRVFIDAVIVELLNSEARCINLFASFILISFEFIRKAYCDISAISKSQIPCMASVL